MLRLINSKNARILFALMWYHLPLTSSLVVTEPHLQGRITNCVTFVQYPFPIVSWMLSEFKSGFV